MTNLKDVINNLRPDPKYAFAEGCHENPEGTKEITNLEEEINRLESQHQTLSYICFCRSNATVDDINTLCSACRRQIQIRQMINDIKLTK